ncbi:unnamed protein product [Camellia sinensis]
MTKASRSSSTLPPNPTLSPTVQSLRSSEISRTTTAKMGIPKKLVICLFLATTMAIQTTTALMPYTRTSLWDLMLPPDDPFRILEQTPLSSPKSIEALALAHCDWKEIPTSHVITLDVPGLTKEDIKIEVEENRVLRLVPESFVYKSQQIFQQRLAKREGGTTDRSQDIAHLQEFYKHYREKHNVDKLREEEMQLRESGAFSGNHTEKILIQRKFSQSH